MESGSRYQDALDYLYNRLPMFSKLGKDAIKKDLTNTRKLCEALDQPQQKFKSIHVAGTNGKGSTSHMLAAVLQKAGYKAGLYTSPHLIDFRERLRINGKPVSMDWVVKFVENNKELIETVMPSFFEITVAMAFQAFAEENVDVALIETGLGGRLDSTNIITPLLSIITNISYDHKDVLGNTLQEIAREKAGIIKPHVPVLVGEQQEETLPVFFETALHNQSSVYYADAIWDLVKLNQDERYQYFKAVHKGRREMYDLHTDLLGKYQTENIKTVLAAAEILSVKHDLKLSLSDTLSALSAVKPTTGLRGRWDVLQNGPLIVADVAHNPAGISVVMEQWARVNAGKKNIVVGFVKDKDVREALSLFPKEAGYYFCQAAVPRALPAKDLFEIAQSLGLQGKVYESVADAVQTAQRNLTREDALLITGSFFIVGEALELFNRSEILEPTAYFAGK